MKRASVTPVLLAASPDPRPFDPEDILDALLDSPLRKAIEALHTIERIDALELIARALPAIEEKEKGGTCRRKSCIDARNDLARLQDKLDDIKGMCS